MAFANLLADHIIVTIIESLCATQELLWQCRKYLVSFCDYMLCILIILSMSLIFDQIFNNSCYRIRINCFHLFINSLL